jgi:hypothetical protein
MALNPEDSASATMQWSDGGEYHEVLELDTDGKGFKPYVTNRFLKVQPPRS